MSPVTTLPAGSPNKEGALAGHGFFMRKTKPSTPLVAPPLQVPVGFGGLKTGQASQVAQAGALVLP